MNTDSYTHAVHFFFDGIERVYNCFSYFDAVVLQDAMHVRYGAGIAQIRELQS